MKKSEEGEEHVEESMNLKIKDFYAITDHSAERREAQ